MTVKRSASPYRGFLFTCAALFLSSGAMAQQAALEEIIVTANKREESMQDAPVAVSVLTGAELDRAGVVDPDTLAEMIPNVDVNSEANRDGLIITIRGVSGTDVRNGADPTTAFHVDGSYVPRLSGANAYFFDTERVEVLRGPQGTLWGRNSTSGVVNVISKKPNMDEVEGDIEVAAGNFEQFIAKGAVNIPLSDNVAVRGAFMHNSHDGYTNNRGPGSVGITEDANDADELAFRAHLLWDVNENTSLLFTGERYDREGVGQAGANLGCLSEADLAPFGLTALTPVDPGGPVVVCNNTSDPLEANPLNTQGFRDNSDTNFRFQVDHSFGAADLFYLAAYRKHERDYLDDNDGSAIIANGIPAAGSIDETTESETWTHEVRIASSGDGPFQWLGGFYYLEEEVDGIFQVFLSRDPIRNAGMAPPPVAMFGFDTQVVQFIDRGLTSESTAAFVSGSYDINDSVTFNAGLRWTRDEKDKGGSFANPGAGSTFCVFFINNMTNGDPTGRTFANCGASSPGGDGPNFIPQVSAPEWNKTTWNVGLDWRINDNVLTYFKVGTGYKSGGWNRGSQGTTPDGTLFVFDPEEILAIEAGAKMDLLDGRGRLNLAAFHYDYEDMQQAAIFTNPVNGTRTNVTFNAAESTIFGLEAEGTFLFGESGSVSGSLGFLSAEYDEFIGFQDDFTGASVNVSGNDLPRSPDFNATLTIIPATFDAMGGTWTPALMVHYESESFFDISNRSIGPSGAGVRDAYTKTNFTLGYENDNGWYGEAYVYNIEDDDVFNSSSCGSSVGSATSVPNPVYDCFATYEPPRTYGLRVGFRF